VINKNKCISKPRKKRITVTGDSHARGCAQELSHLLGKSFKVKGTVMPGSRLENITLLANKEIKNLHRDDFVIVFGGTNDINKNESNTGLQHLKRFAQRHNHTNVLIAKALHRHDLQDTSCINEEVKRHNRKMQKNDEDNT
jgi:hypothetical protein